ncbi:MAG: hypothetical protein ACXWUX_14825 [Allosphingosinicella sp.]
MRTALLAPVTGADEAAVADGGAHAALALLRRIARDADGAPLRVEALTVSAADRLLAAVYRDLYDNQAECRLDCGACGQAYQFTLDLAEVIAVQDGERPDPPDDDGAWALPDGRRVRAPTLADIAAAPGPQALVARLLVAGEPATDETGLQAFLERAAPVLSLDLDSDCPHCGAHEAVRFDLACYLGARLAGEHAFLVREAHLIAGRYGWSLGEIYSLSRRDRRAYAGLIEAERASGQRAARRLG